MTTKRHQPMPASARAPVQRCLPDGDLTARFVREVVPLRERLCRDAFGLTHDRYDAEDLVQETMLKACSAFQSFQPGTNLKAGCCGSWLTATSTTAAGHGVTRFCIASATSPTGSWRRSARG
jgi:Sigma-70 region 2